MDENKWNTKSMLVTTFLQRNTEDINIINNQFVIGK